MSAVAPAGKPETSEYAPFYEGYIALVGTDALDALERQWKSTVDLIRGITEEKGNFRYAEGKWTVKQVVGHVIDAERIFTYRALRIARSDKTELSGFDQDFYVANSNHNRLSMAAIADEFDAVRRSSIALFRNLEPEAWVRRGTANKFEVSVRAIAFITAGHERHHMEILRSRYGC
jgi:hypothetical protein